MSAPPPPVPDLDTICARVGSRHPRRFRARRVTVQAGVSAVLLDRDGETSVLLMRRAVRPGDPWSGHMSFPGGRRHVDDADLLAAAQRETLEETGLDLTQHGRLVGTLSDVITRAHERPVPMLVRPHVFRLDEEPLLTANHEADELVWVPLSFFADQRNRDSMRWRFARINFRLPVYRFGERRIWGLTLMMLDELVYVATGHNFARFGWLQAVRAHARPSGRLWRPGRRK